MLRLERASGGRFPRLGGGARLGGGVAASRHRRELVASRRGIRARRRRLLARARLARARLVRARVRRRCRATLRHQLRLHLRRRRAPRGRLPRELRASTLQRRLGRARGSRLRGERHHALFPVPTSGGRLQRLHRLGEYAKLRVSFLQDGGGAFGVASRRRLLLRRRRLRSTTRLQRRLRETTRGVRRRHAPRALRASFPRVFPRRRLRRAGFGRARLRRRASTRRRAEFVRARRRRAFFPQRRALPRVVKRAVALGHAVQRGGELATRVRARGSLAPAFQRRALHLAAKTVNLRLVPRRLAFEPSDAILVAREGRRPSRARAVAVLPANGQRARATRRLDAVRGEGSGGGGWCVGGRLPSFSSRVLEFQQRAAETLLRVVQFAPDARLRSTKTRALVPESRHLGVQSASRSEAGDGRLEGLHADAPVRLGGAKFALQPRALVVPSRLRRRQAILGRRRGRGSDRAAAGLGPGGLQLGDARPRGFQSLARRLQIAREFRHPRG